MTDFGFIPVFIPCFYKSHAYSETEKRRYDQAIFKFIAKDGRSFEMVAGEGFRYMVREFTNLS